MTNPTGAVALHVVPLELVEANAVVAAWHRHHQPTVGHRFSLGAIDDAGVVHGACIVGRPVARLAGHPRDVLEVVRVATDGTPNACSILYGAAARAANALGFRRIQTYTLPEEGGASLRASGWTREGDAGGGSGSTPMVVPGALTSRQSSRRDGRRSGRGLAPRTLCSRRPRMTRLPCWT